MIRGVSRNLLMIGLILGAPVSFAGSTTIKQIDTINSSSGTTTITSPLSMSSQQIHNLLDPSSAQDAVTVSYLNASLAQLNPLASVYSATTGSNIVGTYVNGVSCLGATFTITATGALSMDGVSPPAGSRVLLKDQTSGFQNGVYSVTVAGSVGVSPVLTRALDYDSATDMNSGQIIPVVNGTVNAGSSWINVATITTCGTDSLSYTQFTKPPSAYVSSSLASSKIYVGNGSGVATAVNVSGNGSLSNTGALTVTLNYQQDVFNCNGSTTVYTLSQTPSSSGGVVASLDKSVLVQGSGKDYTMSGTTLTLSSACATGQVLSVVYAY